jgi:transcriptional regulator with XRE-family HTH domain
MRKRKAGRSSHDEAVALTKATLRIADMLGISQEVLASVIGISEATVSRMQRGSFVLERDKGKAFELARLLLQLYDLLDRIVFADRVTAKAWIISENLTLQGRPIDLIQRAHGLARVIEYLRTRTTG